MRMNDARTSSLPAQCARCRVGRRQHLAPPTNLVCVQFGVIVGTHRRQLRGGNVGVWVGVLKARHRGRHGVSVTREVFERRVGATGLGTRAVSEGRQKGGTLRFWRIAKWRTSAIPGGARPDLANAACTAADGPFFGRLALYLAYSRLYSSCNSNAV